MPVDMPNEITSCSPAVEQRLDAVRLWRQPNVRGFEWFAHSTDRNNTLIEPVARARSREEERTERGESCCAFSSGAFIRRNVVPVGPQAASAKFYLDMALTVEWNPALAKPEVERRFCDAKAVC